MNLSWLNNVKKFKFWRCPDHPNGRVKWKGDIATCLTCSGHNKVIDPDPEHPAVSNGKSAKEIQKGYRDYLRAHRGR